MQISDLLLLTLASWLLFHGVDCWKRRTPSLLLENACEAEDLNGDVVEAHSRNCTSCRQCDAGPLPLYDGDMFVWAKLCSQLVFPRLNMYACLITELETGDNLLESQCPDNLQCNTDDPLTLMTPGDTTASLFFCEDPLNPGSDGKCPFDVNHKGNGLKYTKCLKDRLYERLFEEACFVFETNSESAVDDRGCCEDCSLGPLGMTLDGVDLDLFFCADDGTEDPDLTAVVAVADGLGNNPGRGKGKGRGKGGKPRGDVGGSLTDPANAQETNVETGGDAEEGAEPPSNKKPKKLGKNGRRGNGQQTETNPKGNRRGSPRKATGNNRNKNKRNNPKNEGETDADLVGRVETVDTQQKSGNNGRGRKRGFRPANKPKSNNGNNIGPDVPPENAEETETPTESENVNSPAGLGIKGKGKRAKGRKGKPMGDTESDGNPAPAGAVTQVGGGNEDVWKRKRNGMLRKLNRRKKGKRNQ